MSMTDSPARNGVDTEARFATINVVNERRHLARLQFPATNTWGQGTPSPASISGFYGAGPGRSRPVGWEIAAEDPPALTGADHGRRAGSATDTQAGNGSDR